MGVWDGEEVNSPPYPAQREMKPYVRGQGSFCHKRVSALQRKGAFCDAVNLPQEVCFPPTVGWNAVQVLKQKVEEQEWCGSGKPKKET